jgi:hypothetical protein
MAGAINYVPPAGTSRERCASSKRAEFTAEMILHSQASKT